LTFPVSPTPSASLVDRLRAAGCVFAEDEARLLDAAARTPEDLTALADQRVRGVPLEQILGWAEFCGLRVALQPGVFVPRRRTALLVRLATALPARLVVDLCCGSGAVAAAIAAERPDLTVHAVDLDPTAVACARRNVPGQVHHGDLYQPLPGQLRGHVDVLVANAPYVPTGAIATLPPEARDYEPRAALDGGPDGLDVARRVITGAGTWLAPGGHLLVESGAAQAPALAAQMSAAGLRPRVEADPELGATAVVGARATREGSRSGKAGERRPTATTNPAPLPAT
jgi:release factor glutamine methyltransferase